MTPDARPVFAWHVHHDKLMEPLTEPIEVRQEYIRKHKPRAEVETRLRLLRPVHGHLPEAFVKMGEAYVKAFMAYAKVWEAFDKAYADALPAIEALHRKEFPNCPWNGHTIVFPEAPR